MPQVVQISKPLAKNLRFVMPYLGNQRNIRILIQAGQTGKSIPVDTVLAVEEELRGILSGWSGPYSGTPTQVGRTTFTDLISDLEVVADRYTIDRIATKVAKRWLWKDQ